MQTALIRLIIELIKSHIRIGEMGETAAINSDDAASDAQYHRGYQDGLRVALKAIEECVWSGYQ